MKLLALLSLSAVSLQAAVIGDQCFLRRYDEAHLKKNGKQSVTAIAVELRADDTLPEWRGGIFLKTRSTKLKYVADIACTEPKKKKERDWSCRFAWDGGPKFKIAWKGEAIEMKLPKTQYDVFDPEMDIAEQEAKGVKIDADFYKLEKTSCPPALE